MLKKEMNFPQIFCNRYTGWTSQIRHFIVWHEFCLLDGHFLQPPQEFPVSTSPQFGCMHHVCTHMLYIHLYLYYSNVTVLKINHAIFLVNYHPFKLSNYFHIRILQTCVTTPTQYAMMAYLNHLVSI